MIHVTRLTTVGKQNSLQEAIAPKVSSGFTFESPEGPGEEVQINYSYVAWKGYVTSKICIPNPTNYISNYSKELETFYSTKEKYIEHLTTVLKALGFKEQAESTIVEEIETIADNSQLSFEFDSLNKGEITKSVGVILSSQELEDLEQYKKEHNIKTKYIPSTETLEVTGTKEEINRLMELLDIREVVL